MESIRGIVSRILSKNEETGKVFALVRYETSTGLVDGKMDAFGPDLKEGDFFVADGFWQANTYKGRAEEIFRSKSTRPDLPATKQGAVLFLSGIFNASQHGASADSIRSFVDSLGDRAAMICEREPERILGVSGNPPAYRARILEDWGRRISGRRAVRLLEDAGVEQKAIASILDAFRDSAFGVLNSNPYSASRVPTFGFVNADKVGGKVGIDKQDDRRVSAALFEVVDLERQAGNTFVPIADACAQLRDSYGISTDKTIDFAVRHAGRADTPFVIDRLGDTFVVMARDLFLAEAFIAKSAGRLVSSGRRIDGARVAEVLEKLVVDPKFSKFDDIQKAAVRRAAAEPLSILTGGPGTGKSTVTEAISLISQAVGNEQLFLCAPTGKAAKRLEEAAGRPASTLHRLLEAKQDKKTGGSIFGRNRHNPLPARCFVVIDEASMVDAVTMHAALDALPPDGRLLLVGDRNQLPSVDAGAVLADLLRAVDAKGNLIVPRSELINVYRQSRDSRIATGAAEIRDGTVPVMTNKYDGGLTLYEHMGAEIVERVKWIVRDVLIARMRYKPTHISVLVPQAPGVAGAWELNRELSAMLNPGGKTIPGVTRGPADDPAMPIPRLGDRVMLTENDDGNDVMNGDVGSIVGCFNKTTANGERPFFRIEFDCGKTVEYPASLWRKIILAYAITIHKSQGSQYPAVILPVTSAHENMLDRSILYTGWTRAKNVLFVVGEREAIQAAVDNTEKSKRATRLADFLSAETQATIVVTPSAPQVPPLGRRPGLRRPVLDEQPPAPSLR